MLESLQIKFNDLTHRSEIQNAQLTQKLKDAENLLANEKDARELWIEKYGQEQAEHVKTNSELLRLRGENQEFSMNLK